MYKITTVHCPRCGSKCKNNAIGIFSCNNPSCRVYAFQFDKLSGEYFNVKLQTVNIPTEVRSSQFSDCRTCPNRKDVEYCRKFCKKKDKGNDIGLY